MSSKNNSGIQTTSEGTSFIPASKRADGSVRKEIKVRPGFKPSEDIATYKSPSAAAWKNRGSGEVPGAEPAMTPTDSEAKSKNAKRREAARKKVTTQDEDLAISLDDMKLSEVEKVKANWRDPNKSATNDALVEEEAEKQKKIRNALKKLKAVRELKEKKLAGEKLSPDQLSKIGKEDELMRDLKKLGHDADEIGEGEEKETTNGEPTNTQDG